MVATAFAPMSTNTVASQMLSTPLLSDSYVNEVNTQAASFTSASKVIPGRGDLGYSSPATIYE